MKSIVDDEFPIGCPVKEISVVEYTEFGGDELCLEQVQLIFSQQVIILKPLADTDEVEIHVQPTSETLMAASSPASSIWFSPFIGKTLEAVWVCENNQGYQDQVIFAFDYLQPSLAFVAEGSVLKVFRFEKIRRSVTVNGSEAAIAQH